LLRLVIDSSDNKAFADIAKTCPKLLDPACTVYLKRINSSNLFQAAVDFSKNDSRQKNDLLSFVSFINKLKQADYKKVSSYIKRISNDLKLEEYFAKCADKKAFADELMRIYKLGRLTPNHWMQQAVGSNISTTPILNAVDKIVK
jgi:hypothetical protein